MEYKSDKTGFPYPQPPFMVFEYHEGLKASGGKIIAYFQEKGDSEEYARIKNRQLRSGEKPTAFELLQDLVVLMDRFCCDQDQILVMDIRGLQEIRRSIDNEIKPDGMEFRSFYPADLTPKYSGNFHSVCILGYRLHLTADKNIFNKG